jgi:feruloyl esterase
MPIHRFQPEAIACAPSQDPNTCLSAAQTKALKTIYSDYIETNETFIFSGLYPGGELEYPNGVAGSFAFRPDYFRYMIFK